MIDRQKFYRTIRSAFGPFSQSQVDGFNVILDKWEASNFTDIRWLAYMMATSWHETAKTMQAIAEYRKGKGRIYGKIDPNTGKVYYGRGFVQLTWGYNYKKMSRIIYGDNRLYENPDLALDTKVAVEILFEGMTTGKSFKGDFTNRHLGQYFNTTKDDPVGARYIINGKDKAQLIAKYHYIFLKALS